MNNKIEAHFSVIVRTHEDGDKLALSVCCDRCGSDLDISPTEDQLSLSEKMAWSLFDLRPPAMSIDGQERDAWVIANIGTSIVNHSKKCQSSI